MFLTRKERGKDKMIVSHVELVETDMDWSTRLAQLTRVAWTGEDGRCYFPYAPLTEPDYWQQDVAKQWFRGELRSWVVLNGQGIVAHAALVKKDKGWELGRWVALPKAPRGTMTALVAHVVDIARAEGLDFWVECTQAHTASQKICERLGLRFAGIGILNCIGDVWWDIIYYDSQDAVSFEPRNGHLAEVLGREVKASSDHQQRLSQISGIMSTEAGGVLPPKQFHVLPHRRGVVERIIKHCL